MRKIIAAILVLLGGAAQAQTFSPMPFVFAPATQANASQVMANFQSLTNNGNAVVAALVSQIASITPPPSGTILFFHLASCPVNWTLQSAYNSLFVRGLDQGRGQDPGNTLGAVEAQLMHDHSHSTSVAVTGSTNNQVTFGGAAGFFINNLGTHTNPLTGNPNSGTHGAEVRPQNVSLLLCKKN